MATKSEGRATLALLLATTLWGVLWYPLRLLEAVGINGLWSSLLIYGCLLPIGLFISRHHWWQIRQFPLRWLLLALVSGWTNVAFILAVIDGNVVRVLLLFYLSPVWAIGFAWALIGERPHLPALLTALVAFSGAMIMLWEPRLGFPWPQGASDWLALTAGMAFAAANVIIRATPGLALNMTMLANWLGVSLVALLGIWLMGSPAPSIAANTWGLVIGLSAGMLVMTMTQQYGVGVLPIYRSSIIMLFELVAGAVSSQLLADELIHTKEYLGGALIMLAAWLSARSQRE